MLTVKGFISQPQLADNRFNTTAPFGELSSYARTFSKDITSHTDSRWPNTELELFVCKLSTTGRVSLSTEFADQIIQIGKWIYDLSVTASPSMGRNDFLTAFLNQFHGNITTVDCGEIKVNGTARIPEWVSWKKTSGTHADNYIKVWFSSTSFERDYDEYEIVVVPPVLNVDTFFRPYSEVVAAVNARSMPMLMEIVQEAKQKKPETLLRVEPIQYVNPGNSAQVIETNWPVIIYGPAGDTSDNVKAAIIAYILANSLEPENSWKMVIPDLFRSTQMYILPRWDLFAIPNRTDRVGIYSPIMSPVQAVALAKIKLPMLPTLHIDQHIQITHHKYRSIGLIAVGSTDNKDAKYKLTDYVPDYIAEASTHQDFNRQNEKTKQWTIMMDRLLQLAENATELTDLPIGVRRLLVNNKLFLAQKFEKVEYLVATKAIYI